MKNKKFMIIVSAVVLVFIIGGIFYYKNTYGGGFVGKVYFNKKYTTSDDAYLHTKMLGDVIIFEKDKVRVLEVVDLQKKRDAAKDSVNKDLLPSGNFRVAEDEFKSPKYDMFTKTLTATDMEPMVYNGSNSIKYKGVDYVINNDAAKEVFNK